MKIQTTLNMVAALVFCALAPLTRAQCPQICDANQNTALGLGAGPGGVQSVAVGELALESGAGGNCVAVGFAALANGDGFYQTAVGAGALQFSTGSQNTGVGYEALYGVGGSSTGSNNTATGYQALFTDTSGGSNTANGYLALFFNTTGSFNTATGRGALYHNTTANNNVATGYQALNSNKTGTANTATGTQSLDKNTSGTGNTAIGYQALFSNTINGSNTATGYQCLFNSTGNADTAYGQAALFSNTSGGNNTAVGSAALYENTTGANNIGIGGAAGFLLTTGSNNIDVGNVGAAGESSTVRIGTTGTQTNTYIAGITGVTVAGGIGVIVDSSGHLGTSTSSARYKENIQPMDNASEAILSLQPVTFRYKKNLDPKAIPQFGLVAEQVAKVNPDLVARDDQGKPYSVRYEAVNAMLLNEFLKEHRKNGQQEIRIGEQQKEIAALKGALQQQAAQIQKVSAQISMTRPAPRLVIDNQ
jgi:trimeric autotransporter adhesin